MKGHVRGRGRKVALRNSIVVRGMNCTTLPYLTNSRCPYKQPSFILRLVRVYAMPHSWKGVTVQVISKGKVLDFYHDPDEDPNSISPMTRQRYVEAVTDATFKVRIALTADFPLYCLEIDDAVRVSIKYDGQRAWYTDLSTTEIVRARNRGLPAEHTFARISHYCNDSHQWTSGDTTFGALATSGLSLLPSHGDL